MFSPNISLRLSAPWVLLFAASLIASIAIQLVIALPAQAECTYGGKIYKTGDTRGPYICMPNGTWQRK